MVYDTRRMIIEPRQMFLNICEQQIVKESNFEIDKVMIDFEETLLMINLDNFRSEITGGRSQLIHINDYQMSEWVDIFINKQKPESIEFQKFTKEWTDI